MKKILIKANLQQLNGLSYHRLIVPYTAVSDLAEFKCDVLHNPETLTDEQLQMYDAIIYQREIDTNGKSLDLIAKYKKNGLKVIFDIDDYWHLPTTHHLYKPYLHHKIPQQTEEILKAVDLVTTTTKHLAEIIQKYNPNVEVFPNCLNTEEQQWQSSKIDSELIRFGYIAGVYHTQDVKLLEHSINKCASVDGIKFVLGGYSENDHYKYYEKVFSANGKAKYHRVNAMPVHMYGYAYNQTDVSLVPLVGNSFSSCKSEIKLIEAAAHNNAVICSNVLPYSIFPKDTAIFIDSTDINGWAKAIKKLSKEHEQRKELAQALSEYVKNNYDLKVWTDKRKQVLRSLLA